MASLSRREILESAALVGGWMLVGGTRARAQSQPAGSAAAEGPYQLPPLPYGYADLEPFIESQIMKLHHDVHHAGYVKAANAAIAELGQVRQTGGDAIKQVRALTTALAFNLSGHLLHTVFWDSMKRGGGGDPAAGTEAARLITRDFGSADAFRAQFSAAAAQVQGSGWAVLVWEPLAQRLLVLQAEKHENMGGPGSIPLLALDVWEHAYYLQYQNKRTDYINAFFQVVNWGCIEQRLQAALQHAQ
jgi:superoxide dismutase, Fe-Mn family